jgi:hypothetical protein
VLRFQQLLQLVLRQEALRPFSATSAGKQTFAL